MTRVAVFTVCLVVTSVSGAMGREIGYIEDYVLAADRTDALKSLIPGSEDYYYYHCLYYQSTEQFDQVRQLMRQWISRYKYTARVHEILNRQALLDYERDQAEALNRIRSRLKLRFNHQQERVGETPNLPVELDSRLISRDQLTQRAMKRHKNLQGFEDSALDWLVATELSPERRRHLLERLARPDYAGLAKLVAADLSHQYSKPFGSQSIHTRLLSSQLEELADLKPDLLNQSAFVNAYISKLVPSNDSNWSDELEVREAYLDRLWQFVSKLAPTHNSLKVHVLYQRLRLDQLRGQYDKARFLTYLRLPRNAGYVERKFLALPQNQRHTADLSADFRGVTGLPSIGSDEPLVRAYLQHFFKTESTTKPYEPYVDDTYLRHQFAETKIVNGLGEPERWYSLLPPAKYQALKERVDLDFAPTSQTIYGPDEKVTIELDVKNVDTLIVKVFEINARNYYQQFGREVNTDINLDGLVANEELTFHYDEPPLRRVRRRFEFPQLAGRGVYVVDFIGNGLSSRAVIRKGRLRHLVRNSTAGHVFTILDEDHQVIDDATLWYGGREYQADEDGKILVPYTDRRRRRQSIVLNRDDFSSLATFAHAAEQYRLETAFYVDRESLLARETATVLLRPQLSVNGTPVSLSVLEDVRLRVSATDLSGVVTSHEVKDFELFDDREATYELKVPPRVAQISFQLIAKLESVTGRGTIDLQYSDSVQLNQIETTEQVDDLHLLQAGGRYSLELLGKTGEAKPDRPVRVVLKHRDFRETIQVSLQTDRRGRVRLGALEDITRVAATSADGKERVWTLSGDRRAYQRTINAIAGQPVRVPYMGKAGNPRRDGLSLLELRGRTFVTDRFDAVSIEDGMLVIRDLPAGDYDLLMKESGRRIRLQVAAGKEKERYVLGDNRYLQKSAGEPLQIARVEDGPQELKVHLVNANSHTRVHVFATRYEPAYSVFDKFAAISPQEPTWIRISRPHSLYAAGRNIGDEYQYIIDRKYAEKFPGVMLDRPSLLLNPWAVRSTETGVQQAQEGNAFAPASPDAAAQANRSKKADAEAASTVGFAGLDFLSESSLVLANLRPDEDGVVRIPKDVWGGQQELHVVAIDPLSTTYRRMSLPERPTQFRDLRLAEAFDAKKHFTQQKKVTVVERGDRFQLEDIGTSRFEVYDSLSRVYALYATLTSDPKLAEFGFVLTWPDLSEERKRDLYSQFACHELNFFLSRKDPEFFATVVAPFIANKRDKTFVDDLLLGRRLDDYTMPWSYARLNIVERILLSQRVAADRNYTRQDVNDLFALLPVDNDRFNRLFRTALASSSLDVNDKFNVELALGAIAGKQVERLFAAPMEVEAELAEAPSAGLGGGGAKEKRASRLRRGTAFESAGRMLADQDGVDFYYRAEDRRGRARQLYRRLDKTQEWAENNYYKLAIAQQNAELISVNGFWNDYAEHQEGKPFFTPNLADAATNFPSMMFALSVLDLPFVADEHETEYEETKLVLTAGSPFVVFHEEVREAATSAERTPILVSENFFRRDDRYRHEGSERRDKFVTDEFLVHTVYGCQVVVTNPTSSVQKLEALLQVPAGAIPVLNGQATRSQSLRLAPYATQTMEYFFYFPRSGKFPHYPVQVAKDEELLAAGAEVELAVVERLSRVDRTSWQYISQNGSSQDVLEFLRSANLHRLDLAKIAFRMRERPFFLQVVDLLGKRHRYDHTLWSYSVLHDEVPAMRQFLQHADSFVQNCGLQLDSPLLTIDPVRRGTYQQLDYRPLVNARTHSLGRRRQILNDRLHDQYHNLLKVLSYQRSLSDNDRLALTYYLLLQDRVSEALEVFTGIASKKVDTKVQYDYFDAYLAMYQQDVERAREVARRYSDYGVPRWQKAFVAIDTQLSEIDRHGIELVDPDNRDQQQTQLASTEPSLELKVEAKQITIEQQNLTEVEVNFYLMDIELLFSRNPFAQQYASQFSHIRPNQTEVVKLPAGQTTYVMDFPRELHNRNVLVEVRGGGETKSQPYYSNALSLQIIENYGQLRVADVSSGKSLSTVYVKAYAKMKDGSVRFYKDGYTDLRGRFDYSSLSTNELDQVEKFSLLILSDEFGAVVREANPPK